MYKITRFLADRTNGGAIGTGRIKVMSTIALHLTLNISETVRDRGLVPKDHHRKSHMGYQMVT